MMKHAPTTMPPSCSTRPLIASTVPPVASTSSWMTTARRRDQLGMELERVLAVLEHVARADRLRRQLARRRAGTKPTPASTAIAEPIQKPRASAPSTMSRSFVRTQSASSPTVCRRRRVGEQRRHVLESHAGRREVLDLPDLGLQSSRSLHGQVSQVAPEEQRRELARELGELVQVASACARRSALRPRAPARRAARAAPPPARSRCGTSAGSAARRRSATAARTSRRRRRPTRGTASRAAAVRREQPEVLELLRELGRDARAVAELVERDRLLLPSARRPLALPLLRAGRIELVLDHAQRQELVTLQPQDLLQPLESSSLKSR